MDSARIAALLQPFLASDHLSSDQLAAVASYLELLLRWNARMNLTAVRDAEQMVTRHFGESLFAARQLFAPANTRARLIDVGSGAGFPGLPSKIWAPNLSVTLLESNQRKATFLKEVVRALSLRDVEVYGGRAEQFSPSAAANVTLTLRAVERFEAVLPEVARLLQRSSVEGAGRIALLIGQAQVSRAREILPSLAWRDPIPMPLSTARVLFIADKQPRD